MFIPWRNCLTQGFTEEKCEGEEQTFTNRNPGQLVKMKDNDQMQLH